MIVINLREKYLSLHIPLGNWMTLTCCRAIVIALALLIMAVFIDFEPIKQSDCYTDNIEQIFEKRGSLFSILVSNNKISTFDHLELILFLSIYVLCLLDWSLHFYRFRFQLYDLGFLLFTSYLRLLFNDLGCLFDFLFTFIDFLLFHFVILLFHLRIMILGLFVICSISLMSLFCMILSVNLIMILFVIITCLNLHIARLQLLTFMLFFLYLNMSLTIFR